MWDDLDDLERRGRGVADHLSCTIDPERPAARSVGIPVQLLNDPFIVVRRIRLRHPHSMSPRSLPASGEAAIKRQSAEYGAGPVGG